MLDFQPISAWRCRGRPQEVVAGSSLLLHIGQCEDILRTLYWNVLRTSYFNVLKTLVEDLLCPQDVSREHPLALKREPNGDVHRTSFGDVLGMDFGHKFAKWVVVLQFLESCHLINLPYGVKYFIFLDSSLRTLVYVYRCHCNCTHVQGIV